MLGWRVLFSTSFPFEAKCIGTNGAALLLLYTVFINIAAVRAAFYFLSA
jgi:hypothetical protein